MTKTTLILGAGASHPYGFPTAAGLREIIVNKKPDKVAEILKKLGTPSRLWDIARGFLLGQYGDNALQQFQDEFFKSQTTSIDEFVQKRGEPFATIARHTLAAIFLQCEHSAYLDADWYGVLRQLLLQDGPSLPTDRVQIITFNYDRSLEYFLWNAIQYTFGLQPGIAYQHLEEFRIHHVYGSLGELRNGSRGDIVSWGDTRPESMLTAAASLRLVSPRSQGLPASVRTFLKKSDFVCFLGFGFWPENFKVIADDVGKSVQVYASNLSLPPRTQGIVNARFPGITWGGGRTAQQCVEEWNVLT